MSLAFSACQPKPSIQNRWERGDNLLENASFENGRAPWVSLTDSSPFWRDFDLSDTVAHSGRHSARLPLDSLRQNQSGTWVWGVARDIETDHLPRTVSGFFHVHGWQQGTPNQYLQAIVLLMPTEEGFPQVFDDPIVPLQLSWVLGGINREPFYIQNRKFIFAGDLEVPQDRWVGFEFDLHRDFKEQWGFVPEKFAKIRIIFEARYDGWQLGQGEVSGDVFYDDLYLGDAPFGDGQ
ncbi:MAG: hypothetical protein KDN19_06790 [Verrucomicrobiae bacterium]|nr:hypothetical protein [Verrucomicrobiae bacterium]